MNQASPRLLTIGPSHYCERARWALHRARVPFVESVHPPAIHYATLLPVARQRLTPVLKTDEGLLRSSGAIVRFADDGLPVPLRLVPDPQTEPRLAETVHALEERWEKSLGPATRRVAYHFLIPERELFIQCAAAGSPPVERIAFRALAPWIGAFMTKGLRLDRASAERSERRIDELFDEVASLLRDGRPYLGGDRFTTADLTFAALAAPVVLPSNYGAFLPPLVRLPEEYRRRVERWRGHPAGQFALRMYRDHRDAQVPPARTA